MVSGIVLVFAFILGLTASQKSSALVAARAASTTEANSVGELVQPTSFNILFRETFTHVS
jgi:hypothetical protein